METYNNENEQVDALRQFLAENGKALALGVILGIGALAGWRYWSYQQQHSAREISAHYQHLLSALDGNKPQTLEAIAKFAHENKNTYGALASLDLARQYIDKNDLVKAASQLQDGLKDTSDANLQAIINLRLSRIQIQLKQADDAIKTLDHVKGESWGAIIADIRGEALLSKGDKQGARAAWNEVISSNTSSQALKEVVQMKMNNLD